MVLYKTTYLEGGKNMPNDFTQGQNAGNQKSISLNLDALGDIANQSVNSGNGETIILKDETEAVITGTDFRLMNTIQSNQNDPAKKFYNSILAVETKFTYTNENGESHEAVDRSNYGGIRFYPQLNDQMQPMMDATGQPIIERMWLGESSACGKLFALVQKKDKSVRSYTDFFNFFKQDGLRVMIKTQQTNFNGNIKNKQVIQSFL